MEGSCVSDEKYLPYISTKEQCHYKDLEVPRHIVPYAQNLHMPDDS